MTKHLSMTLTQPNNLLIVNICVKLCKAVLSYLTLNCYTLISSYIQYLQLMKELWTGKLVISHLALKCDLDLGPTHTLFAHRIMMVNFMSSYIKFLQFFLTAHGLFVSSSIHFLQLMELWTGQAILSHLALKCDLDLGPKQTVLPYCTPSHYGEHMSQILLKSCN